MKNLSAKVKAELERCRNAGVDVLKFEDLRQKVEKLGYTIDFKMIAYSIATDCRTGETFNAVTFGIKESDTGLSAFNYEARRDDNFKALQELRLNTVSTYNNCVASI